MKFQIQLSFKTKLFLALVVMLVPFIGLTGTSVYSLMAHQKVVNHLIEEVLQEKRPALELQVLARKATEPIINLQGQAYPGTLEDFKTMAAGLETVFKKCLHIHYDRPEEYKLLLEAFNHWEQLKKNADILFSGYPFEDRQQLLRIRTAISEDYAAMQQQLNLFQKSSDEELLEDANKVRQIELQIYLLVIIIFFASIVFYTLTGFFLTRAIINPLVLLGQAARMLGGGNLEYRLPKSRNDEFGTLMRTFNEMADKLHLNHEALQNLATRDALTDLLNHREFFRILHEEIIRTKRYGHPMSMLMMDVDDFKEINDSHGHLVGDQVLKMMAVIIRKQIRKSDVASRYGGDEFAVLLPETDSKDAFEFAQRLLQKVTLCKLRTEDDKRDIRFGISIGVATFPADGDTLLKLVAAADRALYKAKIDGKHNICCSKLAAAKDQEGS